MPQRSHYVPKFYLENFVASGENTLWVFDKKTKDLRSQLPKDTAVIKDYYLTSEEKKSGKDSKVETLLSLTENLAYDVIKKWLNKPRSLENSDINKILPFIASLHSRVPREIEITRKMSQIALDQFIEEIKEQSKDLDKIKNDYNKFCKDTGNPHNMSIDQFIESSKDPTLGGKFEILPTEDFVKGNSFSKMGTIAEHFSKMNWSLLVAKDEDCFVTCDCPLNIFCLNERGMAIFGGGIGLRNVEIVLPLSPKVCLRIDKRNKSHVAIPSSGYVEEINRRTCHMAECYVFSAYKEQRLTVIMQEFADNYKLPKLDTNILKESFKNAFHKSDHHSEHTT